MQSPILPSIIGPCPVCEGRSALCAVCRDPANPCSIDEPGRLNYAPILYRYIERPGQKQMWDRIATLAPDTIVILGEFASRHNCEPEGLLQTVLAAISAKVLQPLYMLQISDEDAEEMRLTWEPRLSVFAREFSLPDGRVVDGRNPENMRVAFRRTEYVAL